MKVNREEIYAIDNKQDALKRLQEALLSQSTIRKVMAEWNKRHKNVSQKEHPTGNPNDVITFLKFQKEQLERERSQIDQKIQQFEEMIQKVAQSVSKKEQEGSEKEQEKEHKGTPKDQKGTKRITKGTRKGTEGNTKGTQREQKGAEGNTKGTEENTKGTQRTLSDNDNIIFEEKEKDDIDLSNLKQNTTQHQNTTQQNETEQEERCQICGEDPEFYDLSCGHPICKPCFNAECINNIDYEREDGLPYAVKCRMCGEEERFEDSELM